MFRAEIVGLLLEFHTPAVSFNTHLSLNVVKHLGRCMCVCVTGTKEGIQYASPGNGRSNYGTRTHSFMVQTPHWFNMFTNVLTLQGKILEEHTSSGILDEGKCM